jgi:hypothetical protein
MRAIETLNKSAFPAAIAMLREVCKTSIPGSNPGGASKFAKQIELSLSARPLDTGCANRNANRGDV